MMEDLSIPPYLLRDKATNQPPAPKGKKASAKTVARPPVAAEPSAEEKALAAMDPSLRALIEMELAGGRFPRSGLLDPSTIALFRAGIEEKAARREDGLARLRALKGTAEPKPARPAFGLGVYIVKVSPNPRKAGTRAHGAYAEMEKFVKANPSADVARVLAETSYRRDDYAWDLEREAFRTDVKPIPTKQTQKKKEK